MNALAEVRIAMPRRAPEQAPLLAGILRNAQTGNPVVGPELHAEIGLPGGHRTVVGRGVAGRDGAFTVDAAPHATELLRRLGQPGVMLTVTVVGADGRQWLGLEDRTRDAYLAGISVEVPLRMARVSPAQWHQLARRLQAGGISVVREVLRQLVAVPVTESVVGDWPLELRHGAALELERAFVDPSGTLSAHRLPPTFHQVDRYGAWEIYLSRVTGVPAWALVAAAQRYQWYDGLRDAGWTVDLGALAMGRLGAAIDRAPAPRRMWTDAADSASSALSSAASTWSRVGRMWADLDDPVTVTWTQPAFRLAGTC